MNPIAKYILGAGIVLALITTISLLIPSSNPPKEEVAQHKWQPRMGITYPRIIKPRTMSEEDYDKLMESKGKPLKK